MTGVRPTIQSLQRRDQHDETHLSQGHHRHFWWSIRITTSCSEGGKIWAAFGRSRKPTTASYCCRSSMPRGTRSFGSLCHASSISSGRLRDLEVHCAGSEGDMAAKNLRVRYEEVGDIIAGQVEMKCGACQRLLLRRWCSASPADRPQQCARPRPRNWADAVDLYRRDGSAALGTVRGPTRPEVGRTPAEPRSGRLRSNGSDRKHGAIRADRSSASRRDP